MNKLLTFLLMISIFVSCRSAEKEKPAHSTKTEFQEVKEKDYELVKPVENIKAVLVLFGGYPEQATDIKREFKILEGAMKNDVAIVFMNYNKKLWLEEDEKQLLAEQLQKIFTDNNLPQSKTFFGGFSSGGNVALLIGNFVTQQNLDFSPKGIFVVDSPVDLVALYKSSQKNIARNFSELSVQESTWLLETLGKHFGNPNQDISKYEKFSIYTSQSENIENLKNLQNTKLRFYTEPDTIWWKENRMADYDQMNAYYLKRLSAKLKESGFNRVEYIATENKGYRANGERHPHSWAIVDTADLLKWITE